MPMDPNQIKQKVAEALETLNPSNKTASDEDKTEAWLFLKKTLRLLYS